MKKILLIIMLSLFCFGSFAATNNSAVSKSKKQAVTQLRPKVALTYTTSCGITVHFNLTPQEMEGQGLGIAVAVYNDKFCGTHWWISEVLLCNCA